jgi:hypothetical protein
MKMALKACVWSDGNGGHGVPAPEINFTGRYLYHFLEKLKSIYDNITVGNPVTQRF